MSAATDLREPRDAGAGDDRAASTPSAPSGRRLAIEGARDIAPMTLAVMPFAVAIGAAIQASSLTWAQGLFSTVAILAGAAQLAAIGMLDSGTAPVVVIVSVILINARLLLYGAAMAPWFGELPLRRRLLLALPLIDQLHFTCGPRFARRDLDVGDRVRYYVGAGVCLAGAWTATQAVTLVVGARVPESLGLDVAAPLAMAGLLAKATEGRPAIVAAAAGFGLSVVAAGAPMHSAVLVAAVGGIVVGTAATRRPARAGEVAA